MILSLRGGIKKNVFFRKNSERGGWDLAESKISLSEKTEIFLDFFLQKGWGSHLFQKGVIRKTGDFLDILAKRGGLTQSNEILS